MAAYKYLSYIFIISCTISMFYHIWTISSKYFHYETSTLLVLEQPKMIAPPSFSFCTKYLDASNIRNYPTSVLSQVESVVFYRNVTINQIFAGTPSVDQFFSDCRLNLPGNYSFIVRRKNDCLKLFRVSRFFTQEFICYVITPSIVGEYSYMQIASSEHWSGEAYYVVIDDFFNGTKFFKGVIHSSLMLPFMSIYFAPSLLRTTPHLQNEYHFTSVSVTKTLLPSPYPSQCSTTQVPNCYEKCLIAETIATWRQFPFSEIIDESDRNLYDFNLSHLTGYDMADPLISELYVRLEKQCAYRCRHDECQTHYSVTQLFATYVTGSRLKFRINLPRSFSYFITMIPYMYFIDYITLVMSCFGTWLGLSVINFNPLHLFNWFATRNVRTQNQDQVSERHINQLIRNLFGQHSRAYDHRILHLENRIDNLSKR